MSSEKNQLSVKLTNKDESTNTSKGSLNSSQSDDSFKSSRTSTSNQNINQAVENITNLANLPNTTTTTTNTTSTISTSSSEKKDDSLSNDATKDQSNANKDATSKDITHDYLNDDSTINENGNLKEMNEKSEDNSSKIEQNTTDTTPSSSSIDLELLISNLEISDENNELTNSLINLIHKRSSLHESVESKNKSLSKKLSIVSLDMNGVVDYIKEKKCSKIIVMIGAGVSTSAGIPDFRSPNSGIFAKLRKYKLSSPECVFEINYFKKDPKPFFELGAEIFTSKKYKPTPTHYFIRLLDEKGLLLRLYTQNIDGLEAESGLSDEKVTYAHGSFNKSHCLNCNHEYDFEFMKKFMSEERKEVEIPRCEKCDKRPKNVIKPDIVFYGQQLPEVFFERLKVDFPECDLLLIMGTSLVVQPFASLANEVKPNVPRILINRERTGEWLLKTERCLNMRTGATEKSSDRDIFLQGESDRIILDIVEQLGWKDDLDRLMNANEKN